MKIKAGQLEALTAAVCKDSLRVNLTYVHFNKTLNRIEATDGHQATLLEID